MEDLLAIPLDDKEFKKQMKQMRARGDQAVAFAKEHYSPGSIRGGDPYPGMPASPRESDRPYDKRWRDYWQFPGGLGLNIPSYKKSAIRLKRLIPVIKARQEAYLRDPVAYIESLTDDEIWRFAQGMPRREEAYLKDRGTYIESLKGGE